jgi:acylpyruvate hydrolase
MGLNFYDHAQENKVPVPEFPVAFLKAITALVGPEEPVPYPRSTKELDYEIELAIVIGKRGKDIPKEKAFEYVGGYTILNDLSARDIQHKEMQKRLLLLGKGLDGLAPMGPYLVTPDEIGDPHSLSMELKVNEEPQPRQKSTTGQMVFKIPDLIAYWSQMTLEPGDIITSGTPGGVAFVRRPDPQAWFLKPGDVVEARIEGLGALRNRIV